MARRRLIRLVPFLGDAEPFQSKARRDRIGLVGGLGLLDALKVEDPDTAVK